MNKKQKLIRNRIIAAAAVAAMSLVLSKTVWSGFEFLMLAAYLIAGYDIILKAVKNIRSIVDESLLMTIASIGAMILGEFAEGTAVMLFYQVGELFNSIAVGKSRKSIASLMSIKADVAEVISGDKTKTIACEDVKIGDIILVKPGEKIPVDGVVCDGSASVDTSAITGESVYRELSEGDEAISGFVNMNGVLKIKTTKTFENSTVSKILEMVENASAKKSEAEKFIAKFARVYTPAVVICALIIAFIPWIFTDTPITDWIYRGLLFLVVSCPCALVISIPLGFFGSIGGASRAGILIKGANYIERLAEVSCVVFDKTGTLTYGKPQISEIIPNGINERDLLFTAAIAQKNSTHPLAAAINAAAPEVPEGEDYIQEGGRGVACTYNGKKILCGNMRLMRENNIDAQEVGGKTVVYVACGGYYLGAVTFEDNIKENAKSAIEELKHIGVRSTVMLTGDGRGTAKEVADMCGIDTVVSELLPDGKVCEFEKLMEKYDTIAYVGDGINDAPVLARADIGVSMGGAGSDAAIEACDVVIMNDDLTLLSTAIKRAKKTMLIVKENIVFAIGIKMLVMVLGAFGISNMWEAIFADVGVSVLAVLNSMRMLGKVK